MWFSPKQYDTIPIHYNEEFAKINGELEDKFAKISLAKFLRHNITWSTELITGIRLAPYQEIAIKGMMNRNYSMCVFGRGCSKSFCAAVFSVLQCIYEPETNILIAGPTFRTARHIFNYIEKVVDSDEAKLLAQCMGYKAKRADEFEWKINGGSIRAIPLNGEKIRGFRANILVIDEFLLMPEDIVKNVLMPFLVAPQDMKRRIKIRTREEQLIREGRMKESEKTVFTNDAKMVTLSSASYTFENLYKTYEDWVGRIYSADKGLPAPTEENTEVNIEEEAKRGAKFFIMQMAWNAIPDYMIDKSIIQLAQSEDSRSASFQREYCAQFTDGSDSYFSAKKMAAQTIADGQDPHLLMRGNPAKKYIIAIDPNLSNSPTADYFAMCVVELDDLDHQKYAVVHNYACAGKDLKDNIKYFYYLLKNFNVVQVILDNMGGGLFISAVNENEFFRKDKMEVKLIGYDTCLDDGEDKQKHLIEVKSKYNQATLAIAYLQVFTSDYLRKANETLQASIDYRRTWFASRICPNSSAFEKANVAQDYLEYSGEKLFLDWVEQQDYLISDVKKQCASIEVKTNPMGNQSFDMPQSFKRDTTPTRPRKDNYTALMLANWAVKAYWELIDMKPKEVSPSFIPFFA